MSVAMCDSGKSLLVVVDIQQRLGAAMPEKVLRRVVQNTRLLLQVSALLTVPVIATAQYPRGLGPLHPEVEAALPTGVSRCDKTRFSCAGVETFDRALSASDRSQVVLTGMEAHVCVLQTALELKERGLEVFVVEDAVCSRRLENYQNALSRLHQAGVVVSNAESVVFEWLRDAGHEHFKAVSTLLR